MYIGVPKEIKNEEFRVALLPEGVAELIAAGHRVLVERGAAARVGFGDEAYRAAGADIVAEAPEVYARAELIVKVKELQASEFALVRPGQVLFAFLHLAPDPVLLDALLAARVVGIAFETVSDAHGGLPLLAPMSRIAGRLAPQVGAWALQMANGGRGVLLGGTPGVPPGRVAIIGAGSVGSEATRVAVGLGAAVTVLDVATDKLVELDRNFHGRVETCTASRSALAEALAVADLVVCAVLVPGKLAPKLIDRALLERMRPGAVLVDVGIDQGGIAVSSRPTSHDRPLFVDSGVVHYCVPNMPSACARTATLALSRAVFPYLRRLAEQGWRRALREDTGFMAGLQVLDGGVTHAGLAQDCGRPWLDPATALAADGA